MSQKSVYTTFETAKLCHVSPLSIINWVNAGRLPAFRTPGGHRRIRREDLIRFMRENTILPVAAYQVSGEYAMLKAASQNGWLDEKKVVLESLLGIRRAGASVILTYYALDAARWLQRP